MKAFLAFATLLASAMASLESSSLGPRAAAASHFTYYNCGTVADNMQIKSVAIRPDPPVPGKPLDLILETDVLNTIDHGAYMDVTLKIGLIVLARKEEDLCGFLEDTSTGCPIQIGNHTITKNYDFPKEIQQGRFTVDVKAYNADEEDVACLSFTLDI